MGYSPYAPSSHPLVASTHPPPLRDGAPGRKDARGGLSSLASANARIRGLTGDPLAIARERVARIHQPGVADRVTDRQQLLQQRRMRRRGPAAQQIANPADQRPAGWSSAPVVERSMPQHGHQQG